jgi:prolyl oligopeptidase
LFLAPRRLEDPDSEETKEFVARQAELAETVLAGCPDRENLRREVTRLFDHPRHAAPFRRGNKYFHFHNTGLQAQSVLYMQVCVCQELSFAGSGALRRTVSGIIWLG